jgi:hypothetical protein
MWEVGRKEKEGSGIYNHYKKENQNQNPYKFNDLNQ